MLSESCDQHVAEILRLRSQNDAEFGSYLAAGRRIASGLKYSLSIDEYVNKHENDPFITQCAKIGIARSIVESERVSGAYVSPGGTRFQNSEQVRSSWLSTFATLLFDGVRISSLETLTSEVMFVSFNYDRCIEHVLFHAVQECYGVDASSAAAALSNLKIVRPYGSLGALPWQGRAGAVPFGGRAPPPCGP